jgi:hypothetical protein
MGLNALDVGFDPVVFCAQVKSVPTSGNLCPFCVERSAMNILALACLVNKAAGASEDAETHLPSVKSLRGLIGRFVANYFIRSALAFVNRALGRFVPGQFVPEENAI